MTAKVKLAVPPPEREVQIGDTVAVFQKRVLAPPMIEGFAEVIQPVKGAPGEYWVLFENESRPRPRLVVKGAAQADPYGHLSKMIGDWAKTIPTELWPAVLGEALIQGALAVRTSAEKWPPKWFIRNSDSYSDYKDYLDD